VWLDHVTGHNSVSETACTVCGDSRVVSVSDFYAAGPCSNPGGGKENLVMELVNIYHTLSCSSVEIMRLYVVSVCINLSYGIVGMTWRSFILLY